MDNNALINRIETLEGQLMHLEAALDEITRTLLDQESRLKTQAATIERMEDVIKGLAGPGMADPQKEPPPPHY
jgi:uncharacterized coiled-coil protein SlyX